MIRRHHQDGLHPLPAPDLKIAGHDGLPGKAEVHGAVLHQLEDTLLGPVENGELHLGKLPAVILEEVGQQVKQGGERGGNLEAAPGQVFDFG